MLLRELQADRGADIDLRFDGDLPAVLTEDALHNHHAESVSIFFTGVVGIENLGDVFLGDANSVVDELEGDLFFIGSGEDFQGPATGHSLHGIFYQIEKDLFDLPAVSEDFRDTAVDLNLHFNLSVGEFDFLYTEDFFDQFNEHELVQFGIDGADGF